MSRSGYSDDCEGVELARWRGTVERAIRGACGQAFLLDMGAALDALPIKELIANEVVRDSEHVCALGSVAVARKLDVTQIDIYDGEAVGAVFGISQALAREIAWLNDGDDEYDAETPAARWKRMREWVDKQLAKAPL